MNYVVLAGRVVRDPVSRAVNDSTVTSLTLLVEENFTKKDGGAGISKAYIDVESWGKTAEDISRTVVGGDGLVVTGSLRVDSYVNKEDKRVYKTRVRANSAVKTIIEALETTQDTLEGLDESVPY